MKEVTIIDGNNLMKRSQQKVSGGDDRLSLYESVKSRVRKNVKMIFFFDGFGTIKRPDLIYSESKTADELMRDFIEKNHDKKKITVISSDRGITELAKVCGCSVKTSEEFSQEIENILTGKNINLLHIPKEDYEKPEYMSKKDLQEFRKFFS